MINIVGIVEIIPVFMHVHVTTNLSNIPLYIAIKLSNSSVFM